MQFGRKQFQCTSPMRSLFIVACFFPQTIAPASAAIDGDRDLGHFLSQLWETIDHSANILACLPSHAQISPELYKSHNSLLFLRVLLESEGHTRRTLSYWPLLHMFSKRLHNVTQIIKCMSEHVCKSSRPCSNMHRAINKSAKPLADMCIICVCELLPVHKSNRIVM